MKLEDVRLLIVDDEEDLLEIFSELFDFEVASVFTALNGQEGLKTFIEEDIDIIISDYNMPLMTGTEFLKAVLGSSKESPLFFFSTGAMNFTKEKVLALGADGVFEKPFDIDTIINILREKIESISSEKKAS